MAATFCNANPINLSLSHHKPFVTPCSSFLRPSFLRPTSKTAKISSLQLAHLAVLAPKCMFNLPMSSGLEDVNSELPLRLEPPSSPAQENVGSSGSSLTEATFDIKLPRRSLSVQFTCNGCGERTQRIINRIAYERGTVYVQCAGCLRNHKLVDNLGIVVEYDLRKDMEGDSDTNLV
eukprot:TRINITY_DN6408_c0_g1_i1.p1 TRINITY_DN6408_c0_g1~~TRINITY_DN6408_c0_g1_i1.p1  ORF type:complete len:177 (+),score=14.15 TRINITY_DN6408_c0_g1_i1:98-628(+)